MAPRVSHPRGSWGLMVRGAFAAVFWGKACANTGSWMHSVVAAIVVYRATGSAAAVAVVSVAQFAPQIFLAPLCGSWADRGDLVRQLMIGRSLCVLGSGTLAVLMVWAESPEAVLASVFVCSLVAGVGFTVDGPAMQSLVPALVQPAELRAAMTLNTLPTTLGRLTGPVCGAFAVAHTSAAVGFAVSAGLHAVMLGLLGTISSPARPSVVGTAGTSVRAVMTYLRTAPVLVLALIATVAVGAGSEPTLTLAPSFADRLGGGDRLVGLLSFAFGVGALAGVAMTSVAARWLTARTSGFAGLLMIALGCVSAGLAPTPATAMAAFAAVGVGFSSGMAGFSTLLQAYTLPEYRGRVMALWMVAFVGSRPLAALAVGVLGDAAGVRTAFLCAGVVVLGIAGWCSPVRIRSSLRRSGIGPGTTQAPRSG